MTLLDAVAIFAAGLAAGAMNSVMGAGSLITFPTLLALGYPPVLSNVSNTIGIMPGSLAGLLAYGRELRGSRQRMIVLAATMVAGAIVGAVLLLALPASLFRRAVPALILLASLLVACQPRLAAAVAEGRKVTTPAAGASGAKTVERSTVLIGGVFLTGVYSGYFGAAQGVILIALLSIFVAEGMQRSIAAKNVLAFLANFVSACFFALVTSVDWKVVALIATASTVGASISPRYARRLPDHTLRRAIAAAGLLLSIALFAVWR